jgi:SET domain-containing protein
VNFNKLTVAWYANNSDEPNIAPDKNLRFRATRPIAAGEELTARYDDYSENEKKPLSTKA